MKTKIAVIFGGNSVEHEISIITANQAIQVLNNTYEVIPIYISKDNDFYTGNNLFDLNNFKKLEKVIKDANAGYFFKEDNKVYFIQNNKKLLQKKVMHEIDIFFPIVHGTNVEDGSLVGFLRYFNLPIVGPNLEGAAVGQDKIIQKNILRNNDVNITNYLSFNTYEFYENKTTIINACQKMELPLFVKPSRLGSSVGITKINKYNELEKAIIEALKFDQKIIVEEGVKNLQELNISVLGHLKNSKVSVIEEVFANDDFLSYEDKYNTKSSKTSKGMAATNREIPANISKDLQNEIEKTAKKVFKLLDGQGVCRIDFLVNKENQQVYVNEINTIPGSLSFYLWEATNLNFTELLEELVNISYYKHREKERMTFSFETNVLENISKNKGIKK